MVAHHETHSFEYGLFGGIEIDFQDKYGRVIQNVKTLNDRIIRTSNKYNFVGQVEQSLISNIGPGHFFTINIWYEYDHRGRLIQTKYAVDAPTTIVSASEYNDAGLAKIKYLHSQSNQAFLQKTDYQYNIRGWLNQINNLSLGEGDEFGMSIYYNRKSDGTTSNIFNGNIAEVRWSSHSFSNKGFRFSYDGVNNLTSSVYNSNGVEDGKFVSNYSYNKNGNITNILRLGRQSYPIDQISMAYQGNSNQLKYAQDYMGEMPNVDDFEGTTSTSQHFYYDSNGNLTHDDYRDVTISYNYKNLPAEMDFDDNKEVNYLYTCSGEKRKRTVQTALNSESYTFYFGPFIYEQPIGSTEPTLKYIMIPEGRITNSGSNTSPVWKWEYDLKDHLGNVRVVISPKSTPGYSDVLQETNYFPFGMLERSGNPALAGRMSELCTSINGTDSKYLYNGKELQTDFGLDWYDYGARFYDPALGRRHSIDPHAENYLNWTPYNYVANNPMLLTDPTGMDWYNYTDDDGNEHYKYQDGSDKSIDVDGNTYSNIGSSVSINLNDDVYLNAFQNLTMTSYGEAFDLKGKILNDDGMFHDYIKNGSDLSMQGRQELFENKISQSISENGLQVMKGIGAITGGVIAGGELIGLAPAIEATGMNYITTGEVLNNLKGASIAYRWAATNTSRWLVYTESGSYAAAIGYSMLPEGSRGAVPGIPVRSSYQAVAEYWKNAVDLLFGKNKK